MRTILFRGKRVDNGEWVYGYLAEPNIINVEVKDDSTGFLTYDEYEVIPETVGQYTGLNDQADNKIFDGDFIQCEGWKASGPFPSAVLVWHLSRQYDPTVDLVVFDKGVFGVNATKPRAAFIPIWEFAHFTEVIGNIHEHPLTLNS